MSENRIGGTLQERIAEAYREDRTRIRAWSMLCKIAPKTVTRIARPEPTYREITPYPGVGW